MPRSSWRRRTPAKLATPRWMSLIETPRECATAIAATQLRDVVAADEQRLEPLEALAACGTRRTRRGRSCRPRGCVAHQVTSSAGRRRCRLERVVGVVADHAVLLDRARARASRPRRASGDSAHTTSRPSARDQRDELLERVAHRVERRKDVDVIELDAGQDRGARPVVQRTWGPCRRTRCRTRRPR